MFNFIGGSMKMKKLVLLVSVVSLLFPISVSAEKIVFATGDWPPYSYKENGKLTGIDVDITTEIYRRLGLEPEFQVLPWKRALHSLKRGSVTGMASLFYSEERTGFAYYTSSPMYIVKNVLFSRKGSGIKILGTDDLKGRTVAVLPDSVYGPEFDNCKEIKRMECDDDITMVKMLDRGRMDLAATQEITFRFLSRKLGLEDRFETVYTISEAKVHIAFSKKAPGQRGKELTDKFSETLLRLKDEGFIQKVLDKYR